MKHMAMIRSVPTISKIGASWRAVFIESREHETRPFQDLHVGIKYVLLRELYTERVKNNKIK